MVNAPGPGKFFPLYGRELEWRLLRRPGIKPRIDLCASGTHAVTKVSAIGIGAQKCMTSWIHALAGAHPEIAASSPKELDFFSYHFDRGYQWYESHFHGPAKRRTAFESSPSYLHDPRAARRARDYAADLKIIVMLRDPAERAYSNHLHEIAKGHIRPCCFSDGLANNPAYVEQGRYGSHLRRWFDRFPRENIMCLICEEIVEDLPAAARRVYAFLGVDADHLTGVVDEKRNDSDRPRSRLLRTSLRAGGDLMRKTGLEEPLLSIKKNASVAKLLNYNSVPLRKETPEMTPTERQRLYAFFEKETLDLAALLNRDSLPWETWRRAAGVTV